MKITIAQAASRAGVSASTLRYYDKEGLLPFVKRSPSGIRCFDERDFEWLAILSCLKSTGMQLRDIKRYIALCMEGDATLQKRLDLFLKQREKAEKQMEDLKRYIDKIDYKIRYYQTALQAGTEKIHQDEKFLEEMRR